MQSLINQLLATGFLESRDHWEWMRSSEQHLFGFSFVHKGRHATFTEPELITLYVLGPEKWPLLIAQGSPTHGRGLVAIAAWMLERC